MMFKVTEHNDVFTDNPELNSIDAFAKCTNRQLKYVFYAYDYKSPLRNMKPEDRFEKAARLAGYKNEKNTTRLDKNGRFIIGGKVASVNVAIREFKQIQRDEDREILLAIEEQIQQILDVANNKSKSINELKTSVELSKQLPHLATLKKDLIKILDMRDVTTEPEQDSDTVSDDQLSTLDILNSDD